MFLEVAHQTNSIFFENNTREATENFLRFKTHVSAAPYPSAGRFTKL
jgi:hypothetical protein